MSLRAACDRFGAGNIAFSHCRGSPGSPPPLLVTASVDEIVIAPGHAIEVDKDVTLEGEVGLQHLAWLMCSTTLAAASVG
jgi:hypothetical protein